MELTYTLRNTVYGISSKEHKNKDGLRQTLVTCQLAKLRWERLAEDFCVAFMHCPSDVVTYDSKTKKVRLTDKFFDYTSMEFTEGSPVINLCWWSEKRLAACGYDSEFAQSNKCLVCPMCGSNNSSVKQAYCLTAKAGRFNILLHNLEAKLEQYNISQLTQREYHEVLRHAFEEVSADFRNAPLPFTDWLERYVWSGVSRLHTEQWMTARKLFDDNAQEYITQPEGNEDGNVIDVKKLLEDAAVHKELKYATDLIKVRSLVMCEYAELLEEFMREDYKSSYSSYCGYCALCGAKDKGRYCSNFEIYNEDDTNEEARHKPKCLWCKHYDSPWAIEHCCRYKPYTKLVQLKWSDLDSKDDAESTVYDLIHSILWCTDIHELNERDYEYASSDTFDIISRI